MLIGQSPFSGCDEDELFWSICNEVPWYPFYLSKDALNILSKVSITSVIRYTFHRPVVHSILIVLFSLHSEKLLEKNSETRLGAPSSPHGDITENVFFYEIDWRKLERRQLEPPFKPKVVNNTFNNPLLIKSLFAAKCIFYFVHRNIHLTPSTLIVHSQENVSVWRQSIRKFYTQWTNTNSKVSLTRIQIQRQHNCDICDRRFGNQQSHENARNELYDESHNTKKNHWWSVLRSP